MMGTILILFAFALILAGGAIVAAGRPGCPPNTPSPGPPPPAPPAPPRSPSR